MIWKVCCCLLSCMIFSSIGFANPTKDNENQYFQSLRKEFPYLQKNPSYIYLDSGATSQKPRQVIETMKNFDESEYATVHRAGYKKGIESTRKYYAVRRKVQAFLNARSSDEIIFTRGTTDSINMLAISFGRSFINEGDEIIISEMEHHSNIIPWQILCKEKKACLKYIPINDNGEIIFEEYEKLLSTKTKLVSIAHMANTTGTINPISDIIRKAHKVGAKVLIDGAQAAAHLPVDVRSLDADFYVFSSHKIYGPTGLGILYGKKHLLENMPSPQGGGTMGQKVTMDEFIAKDLPLKFEAGTPPITQVIGLGEAIDFLERIGRKRIEQREHALLVYATEKMQKIPKLKIIGKAQQKGGLICFSVDGLRPLDIEEFMDKKEIAVRSGYFCAQPTMRRMGIPGGVRISFGVYNTYDEIDNFFDSLIEATEKLPSFYPKVKSCTSQNAEDEYIDSEGPESWY